jgi:hypothetical protein
MHAIAKLKIQAFLQGESEMIDPGLASGNHVTVNAHSRTRMHGRIGDKVRTRGNAGALEVSDFVALPVQLAAHALDLSSEKGEVGQWQARLD